MPRPKQSEAKQEQMKARIMDAALNLVETHEPEEVSIRMIAEHVGVSHMVFYTYFHSRDALIQALIKRQQLRFQERLEDLFTRVENEDIVDVTRDALETYVRTSKTRPRIFKLFWMLPKNETHAKVKPAELFDQYINRFGEFLLLGMQKKKFKMRDPRICATTVLSIVNAPLFLYQSGRIRNQQARDVVLQESIDAAMHYLICGI